MAPCAASSISTINDFFIFSASVGYGSQRPESRGQSTRIPSLESRPAAWPPFPISIIYPTGLDEGVQHVPGVRVIVINIADYGWVSSRRGQTAIFQ
jgi:hypothetical protein